MTQHIDIERVLDVWLADGPTRVPDRVFDDAVARLSRQPQRRTWRLPWRDTAMPRPYLYVAAAVVLIAVAIAGYQFLPRSTGPGAATPTPPLTPTPFVTPSPSPAAVLPTEAAVSCFEGPCLGRLDPGTYTATEPAVQFTYTVPVGWVNRFNVAGGYMLEPDEALNPRFQDIGAAIYVWPDVVPASQTVCARSPSKTLGRTLDELVAWLSSHPGLETTEPRAVSIGGLDGTTIDLVRAPEPVPPCSNKTVLFVHDPNDGMWWELFDGTRMRLFILAAPDGHTVTVNVESHDLEAFDAFAAAAQPIVDSFDFTP